MVIGGSISGADAFSLCDDELGSWALGRGSG